MTENSFDYGEFLRKSGRLQCNEAAEFDRLELVCDYLGTDTPRYGRPTRGTLSVSREESKAGRTRGSKRCSARIYVRVTRCRAFSDCLGAFQSDGRSEIDSRARASQCSPMQRDATRRINATRRAARKRPAA